MTRRWRLVAVLTALSAGALTLIATTQTWYTVWLRDGAEGALAVAGADAVPVLAPLSLAVLALGAALSIAGRVLAYVLGVLMTAIGATMSVVLIPVAVGPTTSALARTVTEATGLAGNETIADLVADTATTVWPIVALCTSIVATAAGVLILATAHRWNSTGRRYRTEATPAARERDGSSAAERDSVETWDDLSHGDDPTR